jgi:LPS export ABC transporter protein LptC
VPELVLDDLKFRVYRDARLAARGTADRASYRRDTSDLGAERIQVNLEQSRGDKVRVTAPTGRGNARRREFFAWGGVRLLQKGTTATTEEAHYSPADGLVRGDRPIMVRGPDYTLEGPGFFLDPRTEELHVLEARVTAAGRKSP